MSFPFMCTRADTLLTSFAHVVCSYCEGLRFPHRFPKVGHMNLATVAHHMRANMSLPVLLCMYCATGIATCLAVQLPLCAA